MGNAKENRQDVEEELSRDPHVDAGGVTIRNIDGNVALSGTVPSYPQYRQAAETARRVTGVTGVHNHLEVVLPPGDYRDDAMLTTAANNALAASAAVPDGVEATAKNGNLTLTGTAKYPSQRDAAESAVAGLTGVRNIKDEIGFAFDVDPADVNALVKDALYQHAVPLDDSRVVTNISGDTVTLIGHMWTEAQRDAVVRAAWRVHAVMAIIDQIEITG